MGMLTRVKTLIAALAASTMLLGSIDVQAYDPCCDYSDNWAAWIGGALLGAAAGAATGYAAGHNRGGKGKKGPKGERGDGFRPNITESLMITRTSLGMDDADVTFTYEVVDPLGTVIASLAGVNSVTPDTITSIAAATKKFEGVYLVRLVVTTPTGMGSPSTLGEIAVVINGGAPILIFTPEQEWLEDEVFLSYFLFTTN